MTRTLAAMLLALAISMIARAQDTDEPRVIKEADGTNEIKPGDTYEGTSAKIDEYNTIFLVCESDVICNLEITVPEKGLVYLMAGDYRCSSETGVNLKLTRVRFKKGRIEITIRPQWVGDFTLTVTPWAEVANFDIETNDDTARAQPLAASQKMRGTVSIPHGDRDVFTAQVEKGPILVGFKRVLQATDRKLIGGLTIIAKDARGNDQTRYTYALNETAEEFHFFPVVEKGPLWFDIRLSSCWQGDEYDIWWEPFTPGVTNAEVEAAKAALASGEKWLREHPPGGKVYEPNPEAFDAFALMALLAGEAGEKDRQFIEDTYIRRIEGFLKLVPKIQWRGEELFGFSRIYDHAILTLALAEAVADGFESAKPACIKGANYLLASQLTANHPDGWGGPVAATDDFHGGWRYFPNSPDMDISATGWCLIALTAVDAAGIKVPGLRDGASWAIAAIKRCSDEFGFTYVPKRPGGGNIRSSIAALSLLLYGSGSSVLSLALADMDAHLPAATQVDLGHNGPLYYAYYATRASYLRSGKVWETWRTAMLRQLLWTQEAEGSWRPLQTESGLERRFATALSLMMLRMCLNEVPKYLKHEAEGF